MKIHILMGKDLVHHAWNPWRMVDVFPDCGSHNKTGYSGMIMQEIICDPDH